jgi:hypothetical protein
LSGMTASANAFMPILCGRRIRLSEAPRLIYACHCRDCQRLTSSAFSMGVVVAEAGFKLSGVNRVRSSG